MRLSNDIMSYVQNRKWDEQWVALYLVMEWSSWAQVWIPAVHLPLCAELSGFEHKLLDWEIDLGSSHANASTWHPMPMNKN